MRAGLRGLTRRARLTRDDLPYGEPSGLVAYRVYQLPAASAWEGALVYVSDDVGGSITAFSDGSNWRRITDRAVISAVTAVAIMATGSGASTLRGASLAGSLMSATGQATATLTSTTT